MQIFIQNNNSLSDFAKNYCKQGYFHPMICLAPSTYANRFVKEAADVYACGFSKIWVAGHKSTVPHILIQQPA